MQLTMFDMPTPPRNNEKRRWENAFQYGRPCVRALNAMCKEKNITIDYLNRNFADIW